MDQKNINKVYYMDAYRGYNSYTTQANTNLSIMIKWLKDSGHLVFQDENIQMDFYRTERDDGADSDDDSDSIFFLLSNALQPLFSDRNLSVLAISRINPDQFEELRYDLRNLPERIQAELQRVQNRSKLVFIKMPGSDLVFRQGDALYINASHYAFNELVKKLEILSDQTLRAYLLGLSQQSIQNIFEEN